MTQPTRRSISPTLARCPNDHLYNRTVTPNHCPHCRTEANQ